MSRGPKRAAGGATAPGPAWEAYQEEVWAVGLEFYRDKIRRLDRGGGALLDLGCGAGQWSVAALQEGMAVTASDTMICSKAAEVARRYPQLRLVQADSCRLPFEDGRFDVVLCELLLPYVDVEKTLAEAHRVLKAGGVLHATCHGPGYYLMQFFREATTPGMKPRRRALTLCYTLLHRCLGLSSYHYETFQSAGQMRRALHLAGFGIRELKAGGHPLIKRDTYLGLATFFEFTARRE